MFSKNNNTIRAVGVVAHSQAIAKLWHTFLCPDYVFGFGPTLLTRNQKYKKQPSDFCRTRLKFVCYTDGHTVSTSDNLFSQPQFRTNAIGKHVLLVAHAAFILECLVSNPQLAIASQIIDR